MLAKRLEILVDVKEYKILKKKAEAEGVSIARLVRDTLREKIVEKDVTKKREALKSLFSTIGETSFDDWEKEKVKIIKARIREIETH